jgi:hypothetical protein
MDESIITLNTCTSKLDIFASIQIHIESNSALKCVKLVLSSSDTADDNNGRNYN